MMFALFVRKACEDLAKQEIKKYTGKLTVKKKIFFELSTDKPIDVCKLCYFSRAIQKIYMKIKEEEIAECGYPPEIINKKIKKIDNETYLDFSSNLENRGFIEKDNPPNLSSCDAFLAVAEAKFKKKDILVDPLCRGGKFLIEASHMINKVPAGKFKNFPFVNLKMFADIDFQKNFSKWDKSKKNNEKEKLNIYGLDSYTGNIDNAKINLKKAGVDANISCRSIDWMDSIFEQGSVDKIVTMLPSGRHKSTEALYRELFYQASYCLKKKGLMVVLSEQEDLIKKYAEQMNFKINDVIKLEKMKLFKIKHITGN